MDPNATLKAFCDAVDNYARLGGNIDEKIAANEAYNSLRAWFDIGGFEPEWGLHCSRERFFSYNPQTCSFVSKGTGKKLNY